MGRRQTQARWTIMFATMLAGASLSVAAVAYACSPGSSITLDQQAGVAGSKVDGAAEGFLSGASARPVEIRFNSLEGRVVWSGVPNSAGKALFSFKVPELQPGTYTIVATQLSAAGVATDAATTARASFKLQAPTAVPAVPAPAGVVQPASRPARGSASPKRSPQSSQRPAATKRPAQRPAAPQRPAQRPAATKIAPVAPAAATQPAAAVQPKPAGPAGRAAPPPSRQPAASRPGSGSAAAPAPRDAVGISGAVPPSQRQAMTSPASGIDSSNFPTILALAMLGLGCVLSLGAGGLVLAGRRSEKTAPAPATE